MHKTLAILAAAHLVEDQLVVAVSLLVVKRDRAHVTALSIQTGPLTGHFAPALILPSQLLVRCEQRELGGVPFGDVVVGARRQLQRLDHLGTRQSHDQATARAVEVQVLGFVAGIKSQRCTLVGGAVQTRRCGQGHRHPR